MYGFEHTVELPATVPTDGTFTTAVFVGGANRIAFVMPTFAVGMQTTSCNIYAQVANTTTTSEFKRLKDVGVYSGASGIEDWEVPTGEGPYTVLCRPLTGFKYVRIEMASRGAPATATAGHQAKIVYMK